MTPSRLGWLIGVLAEHFILRCKVNVIFIHDVHAICTSENKTHLWSWTYAIGYWNAFEITNVFCGFSPVEKKDSMSCSSIYKFMRDNEHWARWEGSQPEGCDWPAIHACHSHLQFMRAIRVLSSSVQSTNLFGGFSPDEKKTVSVGSICKFIRDNERVEKGSQPERSWGLCLTCKMICKSLCPNLL